VNDAAPRVVLVGRPNVGKSTLFNAWTGEKWSIVSARAQTTRGAMLAPARAAGRTVLLVDTPGWAPVRAKSLLHRRMQHVLGEELAAADVVVLVVDALRWTEAEDALVTHLVAGSMPWGIAFARIDRVRPRTRLLPALEAAAARAPEARFLVPLSVLAGENLDRLPAAVAAVLPEDGGRPSPASAPLDDVQLAGEIVREKLFEALYEEVPYGLHVVPESRREEDGKLVLGLAVLVARPSHKAIVIGRGGEMLRRVGTAARRELVRRWGRAVRLDLWVRVEPAWDEDARLVGAAVAERRVEDSL
jgi:GTP-binding protein Era